MLTRKMLTAMEIPAEKIDEIIKAHTETVDALKDERDTYRKSAEELETVKKSLEEAQNELKTFKDEDYKSKFEAIKGEYEAYKTDTEQKAVKAAKEAAYIKLCKDAGINEKRIPSVVRVTDLSALEFNKDGTTFKESEKILQNIKTEWADFVTTETVVGAKVPNPPQNTGCNTFESMNLADKMKYANEHPQDSEVKAWLAK